MAKEIIWSLRAKEDRRKILEYWHERNKSKVYSRKLFKIFQAAVKQIAENPELGRSTTLKRLRSYVVKDYLIFYEDFPDEVVVLVIWDSRRNPADLEL